MAYVTYAILILNILVFLYELTLTSPQLQQFFETWAVVPRDLTLSFQGELPPQPRPEWLTLITAQFLHGGFLHVGGNMMFLWVFGNNVEDRLGHVRYVIFYLLCGVLASLAEWFFNPTSDIPSLGASGAIAGILGAYILRFPSAQVITLIPLGFFITTIQIPAWIFLGIWFIQQAFYGVLTLQTRTMIGMEGGGVAYWAHAGGFVVGAMLGPLFGLLSSKPNDPYDSYDPYDQLHND